MAEFLILLIRQNEGESGIVAVHLMTPSGVVSLD